MSGFDGLDGITEDGCWTANRLLSPDLRVRLVGGVAEGTSVLWAVHHRHGSRWLPSSGSGVARSTEHAMMLAGGWLMDGVNDQQRTIREEER